MYSQFKSTFDGMWIEVVLLTELGDLPSSDFSRSLSDWTFFCLDYWIDEEIAKAEICEWISSLILEMILKEKEKK